MPRLIAPGQSTRFHDILTNATGYAATGHTTLRGPGLTDTVLTTFQPAGKPQPYYTATPLGYASDFHVFLNDYGQVSTTVGVNGRISNRSYGSRLHVTGRRVAAYAIPQLPGFLYSEGLKINNRGQIVGNSDNLPIVGGSTSRTIRGNVWTPTVPNGTSGSIVSLGTYPGGTVSVAWDINSAGQITGAGDLPGGRPTATSLLWSGGSVHPVGLTGFGQGRAINRFGKIAGYGNFTAGTYQGMIWTPTVPNGTAGSVVSVNTVGGPNYEGSGVTTDINDAGVAIGTAQFAIQLVQSEPMATFGQAKNQRPRLGRNTHGDQ